MERSRSLPTRALEPCQRAEDRAMVLLSIWRWAAHLHRHAICSNRGQIVIGDHPPAVSSVYRARFPGGTGPAHHAASEKGPAIHLDVNESKHREWLRFG